MENPRIKFYVEKNSFWAQGTSILLALASAFQIIGCWGLWSDHFFALTRILLPVVSFVLFVLLLSLLGKKALWLTVIPFLGGIGFYGIQAWYEESRVLMIIGIAYCVLAVVLYSGTVVSLIRTKWLLVLLFGVPFVYRAFYRDVLLLQNVEEPVSFAGGMREMSLLCVLLAMTLLALGMKKRVKERKSKEKTTNEPESAPAPVTEPTAAPAPAPAVEPAAAPETDNTGDETPAATEQA